MNKKRHTNVLDRYTQSEGLLTKFITGVWRETAGCFDDHPNHLKAFRLELMNLTRANAEVITIVVDGLIADHLLPFLTGEEREALRNRDSEMQGVSR